MAFLSKLIPLDKALEIIDKYQAVTSVETIAIDSGHNRVLAEDIISYHNSPPFDKSTMDGYALIAENTFDASNNNHKSFKLIDDICAGCFTEKSVNDGEVIEITTGSPVPKGANAIIMKEYTYNNEKEVSIHSQVAPGENISKKGENFKKGDLILNKNTFIRSQELGLIASAGFSEIKVYKRPKVKLIVTGSELVDPSSKLDKAKIINSNQYTISSLIENSGANVEITHVEDDFEDIKNEIFKSSLNFDVVITTGGTAISKKDLIFDIMEDIGEILFHGVTVRPGRPFGCGIVNDTLIFSLSGRPVAAMGQFDIFVRKYLINMQGLKYSHNIVQRESMLKIPSKLGRTDFIRSLADDNSVKHVLNRGSGIIHSMVEANSYIIIDVDNECIQKGENVDVLFFKDMSWYNY